MRKRQVVAAAFSIALAVGPWACNKARQGAASHRAGDGQSFSGDPFALLDEAEDRRRLSSALVDLADSEDAEIRERTAEVLGRVGGAGAADILADLIADSSPEVRDAAAFSAGMLQDEGSEKLKPKVLAMLEKESRVEGRRALLDALGRIGTEKDAARLADFLSDVDPEIRASAARALGLLGQRNAAVPDGIAQRIAERLKDREEPVRFMCAFALYRISNPLPGPETVKRALKEALETDSSLEVRAYALRALARRGGLDRAVFQTALKDKSDKVAATAVAAIGFAGEEQRCGLAASALDMAANRLDEEPTLIDMEFAHTARAALEAAFECESTDEISESAKRIRDASEAEAKLGLAAATKVFCLARLVAGAGDVSLVGCDDTRPHFGKQMLIKALKRRIIGGRGDPARDFQTLLEMKSDSDLRVSIPAVGAIAEIPTDEAVRAVLESLNDERSLVVAAALDAIAANAAAFRKDTQGSEKSALKIAVESVDKVVERFSPFESAYAPMISAASTLAALADPSAEPILRRMATDSRPPVRSAVLAAYRAIDGIDPPDGLPELNPVRSLNHEYLESWRSTRSRAAMQTTRGTVVIELFDKAAPATVGSFVELANGGFFDDIEVHRVVPNFVVQGGDPTGTGFGDPGYALRCENNPIPYERGTVGMALSGKDTGGSQFFITLSRQPHLDGNYTVFGKVVSGMEAADLIEEGDLILGISVTTE